MYKLLGEMPCQSRPASMLDWELSVQPTSHFPIFVPNPVVRSPIPPSTHPPCLSSSTLPNMGGMCHRPYHWVSLNETCLQSCKPPPPSVVGHHTRFPALSCPNYPIHQIPPTSTRSWRIMGQPIIISKREERIRQEFPRGSPRSASRKPWYAVYITKP